MKNKRCYCLIEYNPKNSTVRFSSKELLRSIQLQFKQGQKDFINQLKDSGHI